MDADVAGGYPDGPTRKAEPIVENWGDAWRVLWPFFAVWLVTALSCSWYALGRALTSRATTLRQAPVKARRESNAVVATPRRRFSKAADVAGASRRSSRSLEPAKGGEKEKGMELRTMSTASNPVHDGSEGERAPGDVAHELAMHGLKETKSGTLAYVACCASTLPPGSRTWASLSLLES